MKKERKSGLEKTTKAFLKDIENGEEIVVNKLEFGGIFLKFPFQVFDCEPHVCDFKKVGVPNEDIAFYYSYILSMPQYDILSVSSNARYRSIEYPKMADHFRYRKLEKEVMPKVWAERKARMETEQQSKQENKEESL